MGLPIYGEIKAYPGLEMGPQVAKVIFIHDKSLAYMHKKVIVYVTGQSISYVHWGW